MTEDYEYHDKDLYNGHEIDIQQIRLELYRLANMMIASGPVCNPIYSEDESGGVSIDHAMSYLTYLSNTYFYSELSRILIYSAIKLRIISSTPYYTSHSIWNKSCGELDAVSKKTMHPSEIDSRIFDSKKALTLKEAFNKIIHANMITLDKEEIINSSGEIIELGINPIIYLYGTLQNEKPWKATLEVLNYIKLIHSVLPQIG